MIWKSGNTPRSSTSIPNEGTRFDTMRKSRWTRKYVQSPLAALAALAICGLLLAFDFSRRPGPGAAALAAPTSRLASDGKLRWFRGNLHTHSMWSDGDDYLEMVGLWYKDHGYDFLCFTDHNRLARSERWVKVNQNGSPSAAVQKLKARFPKDW